MRHLAETMLPNTEAFPSLRGRPLAFLFAYLRRHPAGHLTVLLSVLVAVTCSVSTQYGMKYLIDIVATGRDAAGNKVWGAFALLCGLVAADNLSWRVGGYAAHRTFVAVTGDIRRDLFRHLAGHAPTYFAERLPGALASRISSTANAVFTVENTGAWNVLPPSIAVVLSIFFIGSVNLALAGTLLGIACLLGALVFHLARKGTQRHSEYAREAAAVDGELVDIIGNFNVVRAFGATFREQGRVGERMKVEMAARRRSLYYLEHIRLLHAVLTVFLTVGVVAWGIMLWQNGQAKVGKDQRWFAQGRLVEASLAVSGQNCPESFALQQHANRVPQIFVVIYNKDGLCRHGCSYLYRMRGRAILIAFQKNLQLFYRMQRMLPL